MRGGKYKVILLLIASSFYVLGCKFAPFATYTPHTILSCAFFFFSMCMVVILGVYEYYKDKQGKSLIQHILKYWMVFPVYMIVCLRIFIALRK